MTPDAHGTVAVAADRLLEAVEVDVALRHLGHDLRGQARRQDGGWMGGSNTRRSGALAAPARPGEAPVNSR